MRKTWFIAIAFLLSFMFLTTKDQLLLVLERIITLISYLLNENKVLEVLLRRYFFFKVRKNFTLKVMLMYTFNAL